VPLAACPCLRQCAAKSSVCTARLRLPCSRDLQYQRGWLRSTRPANRATPSLAAGYRGRPTNHSSLSVSCLLRQGQDHYHDESVSKPSLIRRSQDKLQAHTTRCVKNIDMVSRSTRGTTRRNKDGILDPGLTIVWQTPDYWAWNGHHHDYKQFRTTLSADENKWKKSRACEA
jgi:hypothetical protein